MIFDAQKNNFGVNFEKNWNAPERTSPESDRVPLLCCFYAKYWWHMVQSWNKAPFLAQNLIEKGGGDLGQAKTLLMIHNT